MTNPTKIVPVEPTEEMVKAAYLAPHEPDTDDVIIVYKAMIAAAPPASTLPDTNPDADEAADRLANELRGDVRPVVPASILDDLEGLQRWNPLVGHPNPDGEWIKSSDLNAIIEKHRRKG